MLGKTHFVLGMASALVITHPQTAPDVITAMTAGAIGGWIVDVDIKKRDVVRNDNDKLEKIYDAIINSIFILGFIALDFYIGKGMCQYVIENWGMAVWGSIFGIILLLLIGVNTKHRTFTHSFLALALFSGLMYFFCRPAAISFLIGYASHLIADFFNKLGLQLFFPLKWRPCLKLCMSDKKANKALFWLSLSIDIVLGAYLFANGMIGSCEDSNFISLATGKNFLGLNAIQLYLLIVNVLTFLGFQKSHRQFQESVYDAYQKGKTFSHTDYDTPVIGFETWILNILVFAGGGVGMFLSLVIHREIPAAYNGNWWAFCYTSILSWFTVYCYLCNPFGFKIGTIQWLSTKNIPLFLYLIGINAVSVLFLFSIRKKRFRETDIKHTLIILLGAIGGTVGAIPMVFYINREGKYYYVISGFFVMLLSQIVFITYMLSVGIF